MKSLWDRALDVLEFLPAALILGYLLVGAAVSISNWRKKP